MEHQETVVEFFLSKPNERGTLKKMISDDESRTVPFNNSKRFPSFCVINDDRQNSKSFGKPITIRYAEGEPSIYVDEQSEKWDLKEYRLGNIKTPTIYFREGRLRVPSSNTTLIEFLRKCRWNNKNAEKYAYRDKTFFEYSQEEVASSYIEDTDRQFELEYQARNSSWDKGNAILRVSGKLRHINEIAKLSPKETKYYLIQLVKGDPDKFEAVYNDPYLQAKYDVLTALDQRVVNWAGAYGSTLIDTVRGETICNVAQGDDKLDYAAKYLFDRAPETYSYLRKQIGRGGATDAGRGTDSDDPKDIIANGTKEQIVEGMIAWHRDTQNGEKLFEVAGPDIKYKGIVMSDPLGKSKGYNAVKIYLLEESNVETFNAVFEQWVKQVNSKQ